MYLSSKLTVDNFMEKYGSIQVQGETVRARRLITPAERLVLSSVCPTIPHDVLIRELKEMGLNLVSPITFLRIGASLPEYNHIKSFRRQVFVSPHSIMIPDSILINYESVTYRIFIAQDNLTCYACKQTGHISSKCPNTNNTLSPTQAQNSTSQNPTSTLISHSATDNGSQSHQAEDGDPNNINIQKPSSISSTPQTLLPTSEASKIIPTEENIPTKNPCEKTSEVMVQQASLGIIGESSSTSVKRSIDETLSPPIENLNTNNPTFALPQTPRQTNIQKPKKPKRTAPTPDALKFFMNKNSTTLPLNYDQLIMLIENTQGNNSPIEIIQEYTTDLPGLINVLTISYPYLSDKTTKHRFTRLKNKLNHYLGKDITDSELSSSDA
uniref:Uncharacterized protein LOC114333053 n=1 Tax=Diabrotica virgifera virgifera TaxID=50390 RepID=A0A6P7FV73_DIAVI